MFRSPKILRLLFPRRIWGISVSDKSIFLTFDDGPIPVVTEWILDYLKELNIHATFFCVGENVVRYPKIYQRILDEGHAVGNHTMKHLNASKYSQKVYLDSIETAHQYIQSALFRPPYGRLNKFTEHKILPNYKIIMWSWLSKDYDRNIPISKIIEASKNIQTGDILVFHDNIKTADRIHLLLPEILPRLIEEGYLFKTLK